MSNLYFIAIIPPPEICKQITVFKEDFAARYQSRIALKLMPHITLKAPFRTEEATHQAILEWFKNLNITVGPFTQRLENFGAFPHKKAPVVFVKPVINAGLILLQKELLQQFIHSFPNVQTYKAEHNFNPHITVAYRDLKPDLFERAWKEYGAKQYTAIFDVTCFYLLQHDQKRWTTIATYSLSSPVI